MSGSQEVDAVSRAVESPEGRLLAASIMGASESGRIRAALDGFCRSRLGAGVDEVFLCKLSVGASFGLRLGGGERIFLKAHPPDRPVEFLRAVRRVQEHLHFRGFPCPRPLLGPEPFLKGHARVEEFLDEGGIADAHDPAVRRAMAWTLFRQIELASEVSGIEALSRGWNWPEPGTLWPPPHNALFDFRATEAGAERIDALAREARAVVDGFEGRTVIGHADWSVDQMRFKGGEVSVVYDWDSLRPDKEVIVVGIAAGNFTATWGAGVPNPPSPEEARLFVDDFEAARGGAFSDRERAAIAAAATYAVAYVARCEHALDPGGGNLSGSFREALALHGEKYLSP